ncbi:hypothetical protein GCM10010421_42350 [Streptomyces glaucus]|uniref:Secreted protein n=1 Tax=Streptomyces glaucus TaxID=284029 RepID=A0ABP5XAJ7_9ACTN
MPEPTPNLYAANTGFHQEVRNRPERRGRTQRNAPPSHADVSGQRRGERVRADLRERPDCNGAGARRGGADR